MLSMGVQLPPILIASFFGAKAAGLFGLAHSMVNLPMNLLGTSVAQVYYAEIAKYGKQRADKIFYLSVSVIKKMFFISLAPMIAVMIAGPFLFNLLFGTEWQDSGLYARLLVPLIISRFISSPIMHCLNVLEKQFTQLLLNLLRILLILFIFIICNASGFSVMHTILYYSIGIFFFYVLVMMLIFRLLIKAKTCLTNEWN